MRKTSVERWLVEIIDLQDFQSFPFIDIIWNPNEDWEKIEGFKDVYSNDSFLEVNETRWYVVDEGENIYRIESQDDIKDNDIVLVKVESSYADWKEPRENWMTIKVWDLEQA